MKTLAGQFESSGSLQECGQANSNIEGGAISSLEDVTTLLRMPLNDGLCDGGRVISQASARRIGPLRINTELTPIIAAIIDNPLP